MVMHKWLRLGIIGAILGASLFGSGCSEGRDASSTGPQTSASSERGGPVTTASPGGANVRPNEGTPSGVR